MKTPKTCKGCLIWKKYHRKCHFFWENKNYCSKFTDRELEDVKDGISICVGKVSGELAIRDLQQHN